MKGQLFLVASVAGRNIALPAADVGSVSELEKVSPVPGAPDWIEGVGAQRSQALTVIDCRRAIGLPEREEAVAHDARCIVIKSDEHLYALRTDTICDVTIATSDQAPLPKGLGPEWQSVAMGVVETVFGPAISLDLPALLAGPDRSMAKRAA